MFLTKEAEQKQRLVLTGDNWLSMATMSIHVRLRLFRANNLITSYPSVRPTAPSILYVSRF